MSDPTSAVLESDSQVLDISGTWSVRLDPDNEGRASGWATDPGPQSVQLPGSLDENGVGEANHDFTYMGGLSRKVRYVGIAWYVRSVDVPEALRDQVVEFIFERVHWFSELWIDGVLIGARDSLSVAHRYRVQLQGAPKIKVALRIDNAPHIPIGRIGHAITDWTQTNWNGVIGTMTMGRPPGIQLQASHTAAGLEIRCQTVPDAAVNFQTTEGSPALLAELIANKDGVATWALPSGELPRWSDDAPALLAIRVSSAGSETRLTTGYREFRAHGHKLLLNGASTFLRGTLECCVFPKTGYPPTNVESWRQIMIQAKRHGLNHIRFHSWCPPEAAFLAADEVGILFQVELPLWTGKWPLSSDPVLLDFCRREAIRILDAYGHHPSFVLFTLGNEMSLYGEEPEVDRLLGDLKAAYPHVLFNFSSHGTHLSPACDFFVQADNGKPGAENRPLRGSTWFGVGSRFDREPPATQANCDDATRQFERPVIAHEVGEWAVFPNIDRESDYDGVLEARNFAVIRQQLRARGMETQAAAFTHASGCLSAQLYKEEIETLLRTQDLAGFQLLGVTDFPGQGTATIGMLDAFWREKGFISPQEFSQFCGSTVPLAELEKFVWTPGETFKARVRVFHTGPAQRGQASWQLGEHAGSFPEVELEPGQATDLGEVSVEFADFQTPRRTVFSVSIPGLGENSWPIWVFTDDVLQPEIPGVQVFEWYREDVRTALKAGQTVWLRMHPDRQWCGIPGRYAPAFWSPIHFKEQVGTMGTLIQADHPLFAEFPTAAHTEWHWWEILTRSKALILDDLPPEFRPELQIIDRYERNHKLGTLFEARVGRGKLLLSFIDFDTPDRPAAAQLERSLRRRVASADFEPRQTIPLNALDGLFRGEP